VTGHVRTSLDRLTVTNPALTSRLIPAPDVDHTRGPETGVYNVATYRVMVKGAGRAGVMMLSGQDNRIYWEKARALGRPLA